MRPSTSLLQRCCGRWGRRGLGPAPLDQPAPAALRSLGSSGFCARAPRPACSSGTGVHTWRTDPAQRQPVNSRASGAVRSSGRDRIDHWRSADEGIGPEGRQFESPGATVARRGRELQARRTNPRRPGTSRASPGGRREALAPNGELSTPGTGAWEVAGPGTPGPPAQSPNWGRRGYIISTSQQPFERGARWQDGDYPRRC